MKLSQVIQKLDFFANPKIGSFDYVGFLVRGSNKQVNRIGITLDASLKTIQKSIANQCNLLITHHGPNGANFDLKSALDKKRILLARENNLSIYRMHLNLDFCKNGNGETLCKLLGFSNFKSAPTIYKSNRLKTGAYIIEGKFSLENLISRIKKISPRSIRVSKSTKKIFTKIAVAPGGGFEPEFLEQLIGIDAFISGELNHISIIRAIDLDICLVEATHASTENEPLKIISKQLQKLLNLPVIFIESEDTLEVIPVKK